MQCIKEMEEPVKDVNKLWMVVSGYGIRTQHLPADYTG